MAFTPVPGTTKKDPNGAQGLLLGRYEVGKLLGHGAFAKVYQACNVKSGDSVAIKVLDKEKILKGGLIAHIKREIAILRRVRHPNIVQLFEVMATKTKIYFVMEYVRGGELFNKVSKGRLKESVARKYFQQLISAVNFCHARGVYHRDLKPENLLLDDNGDLKVSDFGLSAVSDQIRQDGLFHTFCGTPAYVAPEVLGRKGYDAAKVDIWSCGVILFVLMAGYLPFNDQNVMAMYKKIYRGEFRCPRWFSSELVRLLVKLLDTNPETRITIPEIMENRWFKKGFKHIKFYIEDDKFCSVEEADDDVGSYATDHSSMSESESELELRRTASLPRPASLNAFDLISFSPGFNLSGLFEEGGEGSRFLSGASVSKIISKLEEIAKVVSFTVRKRDCKLSLEGSREGVKGPLTIAAEIFELTPSLVVVEIKKKGGDRGEFEEFYNRELKPGLENLMVQGEQQPGLENLMIQGERQPGLENLMVQGGRQPGLENLMVQGELEPGLENLMVHGDLEPGLENLMVQGELEPGLENLMVHGDLEPGLENLMVQGELEPGLENLMVQKSRSPAAAPAPAPDSE